MELIDELMGILNSRPLLPVYERAVLKTAISFLDQKQHHFLEDKYTWRVRLTMEELDALPVPPCGSGRRRVPVHQGGFREVDYSAGRCGCETCGLERGERTGDQR